MQANVRFPDSVAEAVDGADGVVNLIGLLYEKGPQTFRDVQTGGAVAIAEAAAKAGITRFVQVSAIGSSDRSRAAYAKAKAAGEQAVRTAVPTATILRPSIVFGPEDQFFNRFADMAKFAPALPLIGGGKTKFQPVYVADVADAIVESLKRPAARGRIYELGGPQTYSFKQLMQFIVTEIDRPKLLMPLPFFVMQPAGVLLDWLFRLYPLSGPPLTGDQVELLKSDNIVGISGEANIGTIADLGITPEPIEAIVPTYLWRFRPQGQFQERGAG
jgi:NADH dehydrogenase